jgi:hypothetical protein
VLREFLPLEMFRTFPIVRLLLLQAADAWLPRTLNVSWMSWISRGSSSMADDSDNLDILLAEVRKTIADNKQFLEKLVDETLDDDSVGDTEAEAAEEEFEEL